MSILELPLHGGSITVEDDILREIRGIVRGRVVANEPMARHTTLGVGGPAELLVEPLDCADLRRLAAWAGARGIGARVIGRGSNVLVLDGGLRGICVKLSAPCFGGIEARGEDLLCGAGAGLADLVRYTLENGLGGLEFLASIPGTVGGAVAMNAGAWGRDIAGAVNRVTIVDRRGSLSEMEKDALSFGYRRCSLPRGTFIVSAALGVTDRPAVEVRNDVSRYAAERRRRFPAGASAGSIFKNPEGDYAGRLIEAAGLKGATCGGAAISTLHANFIVNLGGARAGDVLRLIEMAREAVMMKFGVELETEIDILGGAAT